VTYYCQTVTTEKHCNATSVSVLHGSDKKTTVSGSGMVTVIALALSQYVQFHKHALTNNTSYGRNCCLEQSPGTCLQPQRQRSCFQAPDISVCRVLAQLTISYTNQHIAERKPQQKSAKDSVIKRQRGGLRVSDMFTKYYHIQLHQNTS